MEDGGVGSKMLKDGCLKKNERSNDFEAGTLSRPVSLRPHVKQKNCEDCHLLALSAGRSRLSSFLDLISQALHNLLVVALGPSAKTSSGSRAAPSRLSRLTFDLDGMFGLFPFFSSPPSLHSTL